MSVEYGSSTAAVEALRQNVGTIEEVTQLMIEFQLRQWEENAPQRKWYNEEVLALSEMPVCGVCFAQPVFSLVTPFGFKPVPRYIGVSRKWTRRAFNTGHSFFYNSNSTEVGA